MNFNPGQSNSGTIDQQPDPFQGIFILWTQHLRDIFRDIMSYCLLRIFQMRKGVIIS